MNYCNQGIQNRLLENRNKTCLFVQMIKNKTKGQENIYHATNYTTVVSILLNTFFTKLIFMRQKTNFNT